MHATELTRENIAGVPFDFVPQRQVMHEVEQWRRARQRHHIVLANPHAVMLCRRDHRMRQATLSAGLTLPDGVGVVLAAKLLGHGRRHRVTGPALMLEICDRSRALGYRHFFYGSTDVVVTELVRRLTEAYPGLVVAGTYSPPFRPYTSDTDTEGVARINAARADIVWVGLGAPTQDKWMQDHAGLIDATAVIGVGAAFDFHSGNVRWAPRWVRKCGMEWAYRLILEPRRMWRRNLDSPLFLSLVICQAATQRVMRLLAGTRRRGPLWTMPAPELFEERLLPLAVPSAVPGPPN